MPSSARCVLDAVFRQQKTAQAAGGDGVVIMPLQRFTGQALGIATGMVASIEGQAEAARARGREKAAAEVGFEVLGFEFAPWGRGLLEPVSCVRTQGS